MKLLEQWLDPVFGCSAGQHQHLQWSLPNMKKSLCTDPSLNREKKISSMEEVDRTESELKYRQWHWWQNWTRQMEMSWNTHTTHYTHSLLLNSDRMSENFPPPLIHMRQPGCQVELEKGLDRFWLSGIPPPPSTSTSSHPPLPSPLPKSSSCIYWFSPMLRHIFIPWMSTPPVNSNVCLSVSKPVCRSVCVCVCAQRHLCVCV